MSGSHGGKVRLWDVAMGAVLQTLERHSRWVTPVARMMRFRDTAIGAAL